MKKLIWYGNLLQNPSYPWVWGGYRYVHGGYGRFWKQLHGTKHKAVLPFITEGSSPSNQ